MKSNVKRIVIFGINYAPELTGIAPYTTEMAEHFAAQGHIVRVVTGVPHYPVWRRLPIPNQDGVRNPTVCRYQHFVPKRANALGRMLYEVTWLFSAARSLIGQRPDVVLGVVPSLSGGVLAIAAGHIGRAPVGLIVKDLMGPAASQSGYRGGASVAKMTGKVEAAMLRRADRVAVISEGFVPYLREAGVAVDRIHRVRDWTHPGAPTETREACRSRLGWSEREFIGLHAGNMGQKQGLDTVLDAAKLLPGTGIRLVLSGDGNDRPRLEARAEMEGIANVSFLELQAAGQYEAMLRAADVLIVNQRASVVDMSLPSKLASYFASGRPAVAAVAKGSPSAVEMNLAQAGVVVAPDQPRELADALLSLKSDPKLLSAMGGRGIQYAESNLSQQRALELYDRFLVDLAGDRVVNRPVETRA